MTAETFHLIEKLGGTVDLNDRAKFVLSGADRVRYLNGQVTNDVRKASSIEAVYACVTNLKGKIESDIYIHSVGGDDGLLFIDAPTDLREALAARLEKYIIADDVQLEDVTDEWALCHVFGAAADESSAQNLAQAGSGQARVLRSNRFAAAGFDIWIKAENLTIRTRAGVEMGTADAETWRICHGVPSWPHELNPSAFPQEAGLESRAMDFAKGCYIGQEILSRIKMTGKMPRKLVRWQQPVGAPQLGSIAPGQVLFAPLEGGEMKEVGAVTSSCLHPVLDRWVGLAYVRQGVETMHSLLLANEETPRIFAEFEITLP
jgi:folate-binding protein YgfZ